MAESGVDSLGEREVVSGSHIKQYTGNGWADTIGNLQTLEGIYCS